MKSTILHIAAHHLMPLLMMVSVFYLFRGHHYPGGGFIGALIATAGLVFYSLAHGKKDMQKLIKFDPFTFIAYGLLVIAASAVVPLFSQQPVLTGMWSHVHVGPFDIHIGTPMFFDIGVYIAVIGVNLKIIVSMTEE